MARALARALVVLLVLLTLACSREKADVQKGNAKRVVSISPSTTEAVFAVGAGATLVGRSRYCDFPLEVKKLPQVGGYVDPSLEAILALQPDLVIGDRGPAGSAIADRLAARGIGTYFPETTSFAAIDAMIVGIGDRTGHAADARRVTESMSARLARIEKVVAPLPKTRVLLVFGLAPLSVTGPGSFADEMIRRAGGTNVITEGGMYPAIGVERVLALDPDVIVNAAMMEERASDRLSKDAPGWSRVRAVQTDRVTSITDEAILRSGPRIIDGLAMLARALHPEAVRELEVASSVTVGTGAP